MPFSNHNVTINHFMLKSAGVLGNKFEKQNKENNHQKGLGKIQNIRRDKEK